jgi:hypothetical protein
MNRAGTMNAVEREPTEVTEKVLSGSLFPLGLLLANDQPAEALEWCRRAATLGPSNPQHGYTYAFYLHRAGQFGQPLRAIRSVRERHPAHQGSAKLEQALL